MTRSTAIFGVVALLAAFPAQGQTSGPKQGPDAVLDQVRIEQNLDALLPLGAPVVDARGQTVALGELFGDRPVVLALVYYDCPMLCTMVLNGALRAMNVVDELVVGRDYDVIAVSIDPDEGPELAADKAQMYRERYRYRHEGAPEGWKFVVAEQETIDRLTDTVGFRYVYDEATGQFAHASAIMVVTPEGRLSKYFYGIDYDPRALRLSLVEASSGRIGTVVDQVLLYCFKYNPLEGRYSLAIMNLLRAFAILTVAGMALFMVVSYVRDRRRASAPVS